MYGNMVVSAFYRFQLIEAIVTVNAANNVTNFLQQQLLQSVSGKDRVYVDSIEAYCTNAAAKSPLSSNNNVATPADIQSTFLTINVAGKDRYKWIPLASINNIWSNTAAYAPFNMNRFYLCNTWAIDWTQSYIQNANGVSSTPLSFLFGIWWHYASDLNGDSNQELIQ